MCEYNIVRNKSALDECTLIRNNIRNNNFIYDGVDLEYEDTCNSFVK